MLEEFNFSATLINSQLVCLLLVEILDLVMFICIFIFHCLFTLVLFTFVGQPSSLVRAMAELVTVQFPLLSFYIEHVL